MDELDAARSRMKEKYQDLINLWDKEKLPASEISKVTGLSTNIIYSVVTRLLMYDLVSSHRRGRPRLNAPRRVEISMTVDLDKYESFHEAAERRGITIRRLASKIIAECVQCPTLIDNVLDDEAEY